MKNIIRKILKEDRQEKFLNKIILFMEGDYPFFHKLEHYGFKLSEKELNYVFSGIFGEPVTVKSNSVYDKKGFRIYSENYKGYWERYVYDKSGFEKYFENSDGKIIKREYDKNGNITYYEDETGLWIKSEYDENGEIIYVENSDGLVVDNR